MKTQFYTSPFRLYPQSSGTTSLKTQFTQGRDRVSFSGAHMPRSEASLLAERLKQTEPGSREEQEIFSKLYTELTPGLERKLLKAYSSEDTDDAVQSIWSECLANRFEEYQPGADFEDWLYQKARETLRQETARRTYSGVGGDFTTAQGHRLDTLELDDLSVVSSGGIGSEISAEAWNLIQPALERINHLHPGASFMKAWLLHTFADKSYPEIKEIVDYESTLKVQQAVSHFREFLQTQLGELSVEVLRNFQKSDNTPVDKHQILHHYGISSEMLHSAHGAGQAAELLTEAQFLTRLLGNEKWRKVPRLLGIPVEILEERTECLNELLNTEEWKKQPQLLRIPVEILRTSARFLNKLVGNEKWKGHPELLGSGIKTLQRKADHLTQLTGNESWKSFPALLTQSSETLETNAQALTKLLGNNTWKWHPRLLSRDPDTLKNNAKALTKLLGHPNWKDNPALLGYNPDTLRQKAADLDNWLKTERWRSYPELLLAKLENLQAKGRELTKLLGNSQWKKSPGLLKENLDKLRARVTVLDGCMGSEWKKHPGLLYRDVDPARLSENLPLLKSLLGQERWISQNPWLLEKEPEMLRANERLLTKELRGEEWKAKFPNLIGTETGQLQETLQLLPELLPYGRWRNNLTLLSQPPEVLQQRAAHLTELTGSKEAWDKYPALLSATEDTVGANAFMLGWLKLDAKEDYISFVLSRSTAATQLRLNRIRQHYGHQAMFNFPTDADSLEELETELEDWKNNDPAKHARATAEIRQLQRILKENRVLLSGFNQKVEGWFSRHPVTDKERAELAIAM